MTARTRIVPIGNSQGVRIPRSVLAASGLSGDVELVAEAGQVVIRPARHARAGWEAAAEDLHTAGGDALLDTETPTDEAEWTW